MPTVFAALSGKVVWTLYNGQLPIKIIHCNWVCIRRDWRTAKEKMEVFLTQWRHSLLRFEYRQLPRLVYHPRQLARGVGRLHTERRRRVMRTGSAWWTATAQCRKCYDTEDGKDSTDVEPKKLVGIEIPHPKMFNQIPRLEACKQYLASQFMLSKDTQTRIIGNRVANLQSVWASVKIDVEMF